ncbi:lipocalin-like domain-containing protein [Mycolicibacterium sp. BiH015]|uniref:lipocalin-like domain-containing protein n=1 Tax=Mycolicibacterium sp. BiH015 TaxID=3018808 RepID=UPI0022DEC5FE|nr:lipocalin-like domain-containing protein [Mycolicibacterium sp. BiH015]MDA2892617.1 lipocalin-like domain-containing protein [Mycolicibacterium sp. BiH015]
MPIIPKVLIALAVAVVTVAGCSGEPSPRNHVEGTWRMVSAQVERNGQFTPAYGERPNGMLTFTADMRFVEVLTDSSVPRFASDARGEGTDAENRAAMAGSIGLFGTYTVDEEGQFSGNRVEGATFPNWVGDVRTTDDLRIVVDGDRMTENFTRPDGTEIVIVFERVT